MKEQFEKTIQYESKSILVTGSNSFTKYLKVLQYLDSLGKRLKVLIRINSIQNSETILKDNIKMGTPRKVGNLTIYVDSMQSISQRNTPRDFNYIIVYPIDSLEGVGDDNIDDILNYRQAEKILWISCQDLDDYIYVKEICDIEAEIVIGDKIVNDDTSRRYSGCKFDKLFVDNLG